MSAETFKVPEKFYLGLKDKQTLADIMRRKVSSFPMGFLTPYGTDAAFKKRRKTVDDWSAGWNLPVGTKPYEGDILDNEALDGYKVGKSVTRYSTSNKVFRIFDPRGFQLEISSGNLEQLIMSHTIINGAIQGKCIWVRSGAQNVLLGENTEEYKNAVSYTKKKKEPKKFIPFSDIKRGDFVMIGNYNHYWYISKCFIAGEIVEVSNAYGNRYSYRYSYEDKLTSLETKRIEKDDRPWYLFKCDYGSYYVIRKPKIVENCVGSYERWKGASLTPVNLDPSITMPDVHKEINTANSADIFKLDHYKEALKQYRLFETEEELNEFG